MKQIVLKKPKTQRQWRDSAVNNFTFVDNPLSDFRTLTCYTVDPYKLLPLVNSSFWKIAASLLLATELSLQCRPCPKHKHDMLCDGSACWFQNQVIVLRGFIQKAF